MEDTRLLSLLQRNDPVAFEQLFTIYSSELCMVAYYYVKQEEAARDIVQEFFIQLWNKRQQLQIHTSFRAYACRAVHNAALNYLRSNRRARFHEDHFRQLQPEDTGDPQNSLPGGDLQAEKLRKVQEAINSLPPECRKIFLLVRLRELSYAEVARIMGLSVNTIKVQVSKAYRLLREKLVRDGVAISLLLYLL